MQQIGSLILLGALLSSSLPVLANDGGIASIKVNEIRMREYKHENGQEKEVRRIIQPNFKITFSGGEAKKLQQILPSQLSVMTGMQPEIAKDFNESFKTLGIYSDKTPQVSGKVLTINCNDGELEEIGNTGKYRVRKTGKTECTLQINAIPDGVDAADYLGDASDFSPTCHN